jgi:hypothetical protein
MQSLTLQVVLAYLGQVLVTTALHVFILIGVGLILGILINSLSRAIQAHAIDLLPFRLYSYLMFPGVVLHELSHLLFLVILGYKIEKVVLFQSKPSDRRLGYVDYSAKRGYFQVVGGFFSSIGPIVGGALAIVLLSEWLLGPGVFEGVSFTMALVEVSNILGTLALLIQDIVISTLQVFGRIIDVRGVSGWHVFLFFYLTFAIANTMKLSGEDLQIAKPGFLFLVGGLLLFNLATLWTGEDLAGPFFLKLSVPLSSFYAMMLFALSLDVLVAIIVVPLGIMFGRSAPR